MFRSLVEKMRSRVLFDTNRPFKRQKYSFLGKRIVYQSFCSTPLTFRNFSSWKSSVYRHASASRLRNCYCLVLSDKISRRKKVYLRLCLRQIDHSNGKITLSLLEIVDQSFYNVPLTFVFFFPRKSLVYWHASVSRLQNVY